MRLYIYRNVDKWRKENEKIFEKKIVADIGKR